MFIYLLQYLASISPPVGYQLAIFKAKISNDNDAINGINVIDQVIMKNHDQS